MSELSLLYPLISTHSQSSCICALGAGWETIIALSGLYCLQLTLCLCFGIPVLLTSYHFFFSCQPFYSCSMSGNMHMIIEVELNAV